MKLRLGALDELNARPLWFSLGTDPDVELIRDTRGGTTELLERDRVDVSVVSVVKAAEEGWHRVPGIGIAASRTLGSVLLLSDVKPYEASVIYAAQDSRTSTMLLLALLRRMGRNPSIIRLPAAEARARAKLDRGSAALLIGDEAMKARSSFTASWDLLEAWNQRTGLPMVFGVWASRRPITADGSQRLIDAAAQGERQYAQIADRMADEGWITRDEAAAYLHRLHYTLKPADEIAIELLLTILQSYELIRLPAGATTLERTHPDVLSWNQNDDAVHHR
ncbi:MAG TPA: MqnA/MqnD/SBP family protein [Kofleriaceae bacterium]